MGNKIQFKVCGLKRLEHVRFAEEAGASFLGFNFYPKSPRYIALDEYLSFRDQLPDLPKVSISVSPSLEILNDFIGAGFDYFQIHFKQDDTSFELIEKWADAAGKNNLWLAPKIEPGQSFNEKLLEYTDTILWDGYKKNAYGGTGHRSDWEGLKRLKNQHPEIEWILAGGLSPDDAIEAVTETDVSILDFNSGVESAPGEKDPRKLSRLKAVLGSLENS